MQELRAQRDFSVSKQRPTQSRSVGPSISDAVGAHRFPTDWRLTVRRVGREERVSLMRSRNGAADSLWVMGGSPAKGRRGSAALLIPDYLLRRGTPPGSAITGNPCVSRCALQSRSQTLSFANLKTFVPGLPFGHSLFGHGFSGGLNTQRAASPDISHLFL